MSQNVEKYIAEVSEKYKTGRAGEHAYRPTFEKLIKSLDQKIGIINDPKRTEYGAPDFIFVRGDLIAGYTETKDIDADLDKIEKTEQVKRYFGYSNLILTNYLEFRFFKNGERYGEPIVIGKIINDAIQTQQESFDSLEDTIKDFFTGKSEAIKSGARLAKIMGGKARRIRDNVRQFLAMESDKGAELARVYETIKKFLVHDLTLESFADMYAQTLVYGLFVARYHDESSDNFTRKEARDLIPTSNPLLRHFFDHIVGPDFDKRLEYIVNELCEVFSHADIPELMKEYFKVDLWGKTHEGPDPVIHFYEDFLKEYDDILRKKMGAYYTPLPVVQFIVRSVDYLLEKEFGLAAGLADTSKTATGIHRVQILDPAVGTGTFISDVIGKIYTRLLKSDQKGRWPTYVHNDLLPRLHGFELMMAPYTIAHLKLSMAFKKTGFWNFHRRLGIYLTNSLEESSVQENLFTGFGFAESIAEESKEASIIKNKTPIMVVIGNPPYSGESSNVNYKGNDVYKVEPTGGKLQERNPKWLNDDYVKFIRLAEHFIEKNGSGIVAMITAHGYIDNPTFRGMRWHLMNTFDDIYVLDLHGNANKKETAADGSIDQNVFDIKQGVAIFIGVKKNGEKVSRRVKIHRADILGTQQSKFEYLNENQVNKIIWQEIQPSPPNYEWVIRNEKTREMYMQGFSVTELFPVSSVGIITARDEMSIQYAKDDIEKVVQDFQTLDVETLRAKYRLGKDVQDWKVQWAKKDIIENFNDDKIIPITYRPFDIRWTCYTGVSRGFHVRPRSEVMKHVIKDNLALIILRQVKAGNTFQHIFVSQGIVESTLISNKTSEIDYVLPLYIENDSRVANLKKQITDEIEKIVNKVSPEDIFDYIYAVLHSPNYRDKYKEFLKIDFPRVPYPKDKKQFEALVVFGKELRGLHLLESPKVNQLITTYPVTGSDIVEKLAYKDSNVFINKDQYFGNVPELAWNFYIGGYQPAQKWLKDRKGRTLTNEDIEHYQKIIVALVETEKIMKEIDNNI